MTDLNLGSLPPNHNVRLVMTRDETGAAQTVRLIKDLGVFLLAAAFVGGIYWLAYETVTSATAGVDEKKWAMSILSAGAAGLVGYLVRK